MLIEYWFMLYHILVFFVIGMILFFLSLSIVYQKPLNEKIKAYECGFNPFSDARSKFEIRYYLVAILFIIFDLELLFLFPWVLCVKYLTISAFYSLAFFIVLLTLGFIYEWLQGGIDWI